MSDRDDGRATASFLRGLTLGAIIGAIVAGSSIWSRRRRGRRSGVDPDQTSGQPAVVRATSR